MKTDIQTVDFDAPESLVAFIEGELYELVAEHHQIIGAEVYLRPGKNDQDRKTVKLKLNVPGPDLFAKLKSDSFENGIMEAVAKIKRQLGRNSNRNGRRN